MSRGWMDCELFMQKEPFDRRSAWVYLIENAAWKQRNFVVGNSVIRLERGQLTVSLRYLSEAWEWSTTKVRGYLKLLQNLAMIKLAKNTGQNLITICNYDTYQYDTLNKDTDKNSEKHDKNTDETQMKHKTKKVNKEKKVNKVSNIFIKPTIKEIYNYFLTRDFNNQDEAEKMFDYYESKGWVVGKGKMKKWDAACRTWIRNYHKYNNKPIAYQKEPTVDPAIDRLKNRLNPQQNEMKVIN